MGREKDRLLQAEDDWLQLARHKGYICKSCQLSPPYCDRETFFRTGMCGYCDNMEKKNK